MCGSLRVFCATIPVTVDTCTARVCGVFVLLEPPCGSMEWEAFRVLIDGLHSALRHSVRARGGAVIRDILNVIYCTVPVVVFLRGGASV